MLDHTSWTNFFIAFASMSALWYLGLLLTVFRKDAVAFVSGESDVPSPLVQVMDAVELKAANSEDDVMGTSKMPDGLETISMSALAFSPMQSASLADQQKADQLGLVPDVLQELKDIFDILSREDGTKTDFLSLVSMVNEKYGRIGSHPNIAQVNDFIRERAPFAISNDELDNLWD